MSYTKPVFTHGDFNVKVQSAVFDAPNTNPLQTALDTDELMQGEYEVWLHVSGKDNAPGLYQLVKRNAANDGDVWVANGYCAANGAPPPLYLPRVSVTNQERFRVRITPALVNDLFTATLFYRQVRDRTTGEPDYYGGSV